jgi:hypothetical protein
MGYIILWIIFSLIGYIIGKPKGKESLGAILGLLLGPIGILIIVIMENQNITKCRTCFGKVDVLAIKCMHCGADLRVIKPQKATVVKNSGGDKGVEAMIREDEERLKKIRSGRG